MDLIITNREELRQLLADECRRAVEDAVAGLETTAAMGADPLAIVPDRLYTAAEANDLLRLGGESGRMTIYDIPEADLPRCRVGPARGSLRFLGADLLGYARGLAAVDVQEIVDGARASLQRRLSRPSSVAGVVGVPSGRRRIV